MSERTIPIIRLEVSGMKHTILRAFSEYMTDLDSDVQAAVETYCSGENIKRVIAAVVSTEIEMAIREETHNYFRYGKGREIIKAAVARRLAEDGEP